MPYRGPAAGLRFICYAALAIVIMFLDQRGGWLGRARYGLQAIAYPLRLAVNSPSQAWRWIRDAAETRDSLRAENGKLRDRMRVLELEALRVAALERENAELRGLKAALPPVAEKYLTAEVIDSEYGSLRQRLVVNRGAQHSVIKGQAVLASGGVLGQTLRTGPWTTEVILITDPEHAIPVQVARTGLRTIAVGVGERHSLLLPYLPIQADIRVGDDLLTSGVGGVFPGGYPVARVIEVKRDGVAPLAQVRAMPFAALDHDREVMLIWLRPGHPATPVGGAADPMSMAALGIQPQVVPAPATTPPASTVAPTIFAAPATAVATVAPPPKPEPRR